LIWQAIFLGTIQGLTEFLPVSSSAHLILIPLVFHWDSPLLNSLTFDVALHGGTLLAAMTYFWDDLKDLALCWFEPMDSPTRRGDRRLAVLLAVATFPGALAGYKLDRYAEETFRSPALMACTFILFGVLMGAADYFRKQEEDTSRLSVFKAFLAGCFQALAIIPGISRSGSTLTFLRLIQVTRPDAARFSFLMSIPLIAGAVIFKGKHIAGDLASPDMGAILAGVLTSWVVGYLSIRFFMKLLRQNVILWFSVYRIVVGSLILAWIKL